MYINSKSNFGMNLFQNNLTAFDYILNVLSTSFNFMSNVLRIIQFILYTL